MKTRIAILALLVSLAYIAPAQAQLENYFDCTLNDGKTTADLIRFKTEYEAAAIADGIEDYNLKVILPVYSENRKPGAFFWYGSFRDFEHLGTVSAWFNESDWPARFNTLMTCEGSSLWRAFD